MKIGQIFKARRSGWLRYGAAVVFNVAATLITMGLWSLLQPRTTALFLAAVTVTAWYGGFAPALLATALAAVSMEYFFDAPIHSFSISWAHIVQLTAFVLVALLVSWLNAARELADDTAQNLNQTIQAIVRASPLPIFVLDLDMNVKIWNPAAMYVFGWSEQELRGLPLPIVPPFEQKVVRTLRDRVLEGESFVGIKSHRLRRDGVMLEVNTSTAPLHDARGNVNGIMVVVTNVVELPQPFTESARIPNVEKDTDVLESKQQKYGADSLLLGGD